MLAFCFPCFCSFLAEFILQEVKFYLLIPDLPADIKTLWKYLFMFLTRILNNFGNKKVEDMWYKRESKKNDRYDFSVKKCCVCR